MVGSFNKRDGYAWVQDMRANYVCIHNGELGRRSSRPRGSLGRSSFTDPRTSTLYSMRASWTLLRRCLAPRKLWAARRRRSATCHRSG